ncbi:hypothetical protein B2H94_09975 [Clostridium sporogenes]|uniref:Uncharacterized protein n=1 Tax=Clostridium sporogenes TaxID=1509 RepID=A0ABD6RSV0_CLOSG|nr:hypothetical protein B2H94_09975 [Clostridium sporogenes]
MPIVFSGIALVISIFNIYKSWRNDKSLEKYRNWQSDFELYKEKMRQQEKQSDNIVLKLNSRAGLIPYFHLLLDDSNIIFEKNNIILGITLINVGKECASNVMLYPIDGKSGSENYFKTENKEKNNHFIHNYLNQYYALPREKVSFSMITEVPKEGNGYVVNFVQFKIRFSDLVGNLYEQKFRFGYDNYMVKGFNRDNISDLPKFIEDK